ncbi:hypothetical protein [Candidatus Entotheonella palauensis]|uniref:hypothetical protein n=1 Tax=Candidatus Entotheonella palauensis TaxID=93172 RepID=UPI000B7C6DE8|nr:hypothetical protein [Candidatus Entotheonella palauensis]
MIVDPRAKVHATTGILPMQELAIPPDQYQQFLNHLHFTFLVNPILASTTAPNVPLPAETRPQWSWLRLQANGHPASPVDDLRQPDDRATHAYTPQQIQEGWLQVKIDE